MEVADVLIPMPSVYGKQRSEFRLESQRRNGAHTNIHVEKHIDQL